MESITFLRYDYIPETKTINVFVVDEGQHNEPIQAGEIGDAHGSDNWDKLIDFAKLIDTDIVVVWDDQEQTYYPVKGKRYTKENCKLYKYEEGEPNEQWGIDSGPRLLMLVHIPTERIMMEYEQPLESQWNDPTSWVEMVIASYNEEDEW